ncbi:M3 family metallopeptidase [Actomonas aquatica]|uniref:oligopeptidase A n=1 Tax=Actomonas aquatica TaxID=2866162 RepID=A0ABZ1C7T9_9BACT|nr:M3 family metallopeptidase [Opitutus sp. WL0086]WRQ87700.1 M3 family metallopeptidase [Opitutus sp. WL0086]
MAENPFLSTDFDIRWSAHTPDLIEPAIQQALTDAQATIDGIAALPLEEVNYANTFLALEESTEILNLAWGKVSHLQSVADEPALREAQNKMLPEVSTFFARIPLNPALWERLRAYAESDAGQAHTGIHRRFIDETVADFRQAGADLPDAQRQRLEEIQSELAQLTQKYSENVLDATNAWQLLVDDVSRLAGIPQHARDTARRSAESKGLGSPEKPVWRFTLHHPSLEPVMVYAEDAELRRQMWEGSVAVGSAEPHDNRPLVPKILALRHEEAQLLGQPHFADHVLARRMAGNGRQALDFIVDLQTKAADAFAQENAELEAFKAAQTGEPQGRLKAWEVSYWAEKLRRERYAFDDESLRPYFPMNRVIDGLFELSSRIFGLVIKARPAGEVEVWHDEVKAYTIHDRDGRHLGSFYADWHPRESKRGGAWMGYLITGGPQPDGSRKPHLGYILGNMTPPADGKPALLTHREVETVFHEFGHLLHHLLGEVEIKSLNGVNVAWDFVELPSQIMENWCWERESLDLFARHHETGEPIPEDMFQKMVAARNFRSACATTRQVQFAKMDLLLHTNTEAYLADAATLEQRITADVADTMVPTEPAGRPILYRFGHLFSDPTGYAAGYYSYKWAEVLDADAFGRFKEEGIFNPDTGADFVRHILSKGNSEDPAALFRAFRGRDPDVNALLERCGLRASA